MTSPTAPTTITPEQAAIIVPAVLQLVENQKLQAEQQQAAYEQQQAAYEQQQAAYEQQQELNTQIFAAHERLFSELELLKHGLVIIGGKPVADFYGITIETKSELQEAAQEVYAAQQEDPEAFAEHSIKCHTDKEYRKANPSPSRKGLAIARKPDASKSEWLSFSIWLAGLYHKCFGVRPAAPLGHRHKNGDRAYTVGHYPAASHRFCEVAADYYFSERVDVDGKPATRAY